MLPPFEVCLLVLGDQENRNFLFGLENGTIVRPLRLFATLLNDFSSASFDGPASVRDL
jgi:hypothetical protein